MRRRRPSLFRDVPALVELLEPRRMLSADGATLGAQTPIALDTTGSQSAPKIASDGNGDYVIVWKSNSQDGQSAAINAQEFHADGSPLGMRLTVSTDSSNLNGQPTVAMDAAGDFVVAWTSESQNGNASNVDVQRYDLNGTPLGDQFVVANTLAGNQSSPSIAIDAQGDFVVAWVNETGSGSTEHVYAQRFDVAEPEQVSTFLVGQSSTAMADQPSVAMDAAGNFVVTWQSVSTSGSVLGIEAQRYNSSGNVVGSEMTIAPATAVNQLSPAVAMEPAGDFVIAWQSGSSGQANSIIFAEHFTVAGLAQGSPFAVSGSQVSQDNVTPAMAMNASGDFVVAWAGVASNSSQSTIFTQRYGASGNSQGAAEQFSASTTIDQHAPSVALQPDGNWVVAWNGQPQSSNNSSVYTQQSGQFSAIQTGVMQVSPTTAEPSVPTSLVSIIGSLPITPDESQFGGLSNSSTFFNNTTVGIPVDLQFYPQLFIYPQLVWGTVPPWLALGLNSPYDLLWYR